MDGLIGLLILLGLVAYMRSRAAARRNAQTRNRTAAARVNSAKSGPTGQPSRLNTKAAQQRNSGGQPQASRRAQPPGRRPGIIIDILKGNRGGQQPVQPRRDYPAAEPTAAPDEWSAPAGRQPGLTFEEEARALEAAYNQLGNVFDEAIDQLTAHIPADATLQPPPGETARQVKPAQPLVTTDLQEIKQGIILANVLERPKIRQAPAAIRRKGV